MAGKKMDIGPSGSTVASNVATIRERRGLTWTALSARIASSTGRDLSPLALRRIEERARRVDVDDLMVLAAALGVAPVTLLMPDTSDSQDRVELSGIGEVKASIGWEWMRAEGRIPDGAIESDFDFFNHALPVWRRKQLAAGLRELADLDAGGERAQAIHRKYRRANGDD